MTMPPTLASGPGSFRLVIDLWMSFLRNHCFLLSLSSIHPPQAQSLPIFAKSPSEPSLSSSTTASPFILSPYNSFSPSYNQPGLVHLLIPPGTSTSLPKLSPPPFIIVNPPSPPNNKRNIAALTCSFGCLSVKQ